MKELSEELEDVKLGLLWIICETGITLDYLTKLYNGYEEFIKQISKVIPVLRVNYSKFKTAEEMAEIIKKEYESMQNVRKVDYEEAQ